MKYLSHLLILILLSSCSSLAFWDNQEEDVEPEETAETIGIIDRLTFWNNGDDEIDLSEPKLLEDFDLLVYQYDKKYKKNKKLSRKNFINTHYVLYQLLRRHKYPCKKTDFNILKSNERKSFHDKICKELFKDLGWNFTTTF